MNSLADWNNEPEKYDECGVYSHAVPSMSDKETSMKESIRRLIIIGLWGLPFWSRCVVVDPDTPAWYMQKTPPTTNLWYEADDSVRIANEENGVFFIMSPDELISMTGRGLLDKPYQWLTKDDKVAKEHVPKMLEALSRSGSDCQITNILHQALLAPTNHYREATFRAYVMASPVPMTVLAETVVKIFPLKRGRRGTPDPELKRWKHIAG